MKAPTPKFEIGEIVCRPSFKDCFGEVHPRIELLRVIERRLINNDEVGEQFRLASYWRIKAATPNVHGLAWFEGSERFFEKLGGVQS